MLPKDSTAADQAQADGAGEKQAEAFEVEEANTLRGNRGHYCIEGLLGEGAYGTVLRCQEMVSGKRVALKIHRTEETSQCEIRMLEALSALDPAKNNIVHFLDSFSHRGHTCLVFEMLDRSLWDLMVDQHMKSLCLSEIRPIAHQLLTAFDALMSIGVIYSDLKLDNIMLVNHKAQPFRLKLIDFGMSFPTMDANFAKGMSIQPLGDRAPEVVLGLHVTEAIDMWGVGCILGCLYIGKHLFSGKSEYLMLRSMVDTLGPPPDHLLSTGQYTQRFFKENVLGDFPKWWLKTPEEHELETGAAPGEWKRPITCLEELVRSGKQEWVMLEDRRAFVSLLKGLLHMDPQMRVTPGRALQHSFLSMGHLLEQRDGSVYVKDCFDKMQVCPLREGGPPRADGTLAPPPQDRAGTLWATQRQKEKRSLLKGLRWLLQRLHKTLFFKRNKVFPDMPSA